MKKNYDKWISSGTPFVWLNAGAVAISILMVAGVLGVLVVKGMANFWPADVLQAEYQPPAEDGPIIVSKILGESVDSETVLASQIISSGIPVSDAQDFYSRQLIKRGNRDVSGADFAWVLSDFINGASYPQKVVTIERREWGNFYGFLINLFENDIGLIESGEAKSGQTDLWYEFSSRIDRAVRIQDDISKIEKEGIDEVNYELERLRLLERRLEINNELDSMMIRGLADDRARLDEVYSGLQEGLSNLYLEVERDRAVFLTADGVEKSIQLSDIVRAYRANSLNIFEKLLIYFSKISEFLTDEPREANTEGGIFPAIFGTVMMVLLMSVFVTPFGVVAAVYLREYAKQGTVTNIIRVAVNNLAGVPSIVYGVFGLGFFIYIVGGGIDQFFYSEALPAPTFGTPGLLWASLTLALLTVPVVIVSTEEGLARIPRSVREGSLALGATKFETLWRVVLPMASPAMMTGLILAVARAAGEVAPLMLVGVVKLAPSLPVDGNYPYLHLDQQFMHLGFHIYDVGFQSPNIEAARPLVFATALLLVIVVAVLNVSAVSIRNRLREKFKSLDV
jgi:phosphate transport system permease protein